MRTFSWNRLWQRGKATISCSNESCLPRRKKAHLPLILPLCCALLPVCHYISDPTPCFPLFTYAETMCYMIRSTKCRFIDHFHMGLFCRCLSLCNINLLALCVVSPLRAAEIPLRATSPSPLQSVSRPLIVFRAFLSQIPARFLPSVGGTAQIRMQRDSVP